MNPTYESYSSYLMTMNSNYRNQPEASVLQAEANYAGIVVIASVESVAALTFCTLTAPLACISSQPLMHAFTWLKSSTFCILWAGTDLILNPFLHQLLTFEQNARNVARTGRIFSLENE